MYHKDVLLTNVPPVAEICDDEELILGPRQGLRLHSQVPRLVIALQAEKNLDVTPFLAWCRCLSS